MLSYRRCTLYHLMCPQTPNLVVNSPHLEGLHVLTQPHSSDRLHLAIAFSRLQLRVQGSAFPCGQSKSRRNSRLALTCSKKNDAAAVDIVQLTSNIAVSANDRFIWCSLTRTQDKYIVSKLNKCRPKNNTGMAEPLAQSPKTARPLCTLWYRQLAEDLISACICAACAWIISLARQD